MMDYSRLKALMLFPTDSTRAMLFCKIQKPEDSFRDEIARVIFGDIGSIRDGTTIVCLSLSNRYGWIR